MADWLLYEHDDGRYAVAPSAEAATFAKGDPAWHRVGPVEVPMQPALSAGTLEACPELNLSNYDAVDVERLNDWGIRADAEIEELRWVVNGFLEWHEGCPCQDGLIQRARAAVPPGAQATSREVPPGKWKVDLPDGTYTQLPGDAPGPGDVRAVLGGFVYRVTPQTGKLVAMPEPSEFALKNGAQSARGVLGTPNDQQEK